MTLQTPDYDVIIYHNFMRLKFIACVCRFFLKINLHFLNLEHVYMRLEVNSNQFEISNRFEKSFRLRGNFTTANFEISNHLSKTVSFTWRFLCDNFLIKVRLWWTCANDSF